MTPSSLQNMLSNLTHLEKTRPIQTLRASVLPVPEQISELCKIHPRSVALSWGDRQMSYEEFDRRADRFAGYLMQLGIVCGDTVAICMERSFDWIVAALGVMRSGAAYVPLDPSWPDSRLRFAVNDSGATILVARAALLDRLQVKVRGIDPCRDAAAIAASIGATRRTVEPEGLAYVIYTSGSTGVPKGVEITHANLGHLIRWHRDAFRVTQQDRVSHLAGLGFDAAVWEIWPHLAAGATVCLADDAVRSSPELRQQWIIRERVTIAFVPTVHAASMIAMKWPATTALRLLLTGGDVLHHGPAVKLPFDVVNNYGPTECTVVATSSVLKPGSPGAPPIGRPIAGANVYLLDEQGERVPEGSTGEIYIGGAGVGRGYRNLPDSTERSFRPDPFAGVPGARMYRTGDRGVRRPDGEIEFRGRLDRQTKIRGQRVELDEIGSILTNHPAIEFATAITNLSEGGENQLVAYILPKENAFVPTARELQRHLLRSLPDYMTPAIFVRLRALPLSQNGKIDLRMLPQPTDANLLETTAAKAPATPIEEKLLTMVRELLENDAVATEDNFFLAGGHSLLGMQLVMQLRNAFGVDLTLRQLFEAPTVERLAFSVETMLTQRLANDEPALPPGVLALQTYGTRNSIFWVHYLNGNLAKAIGDDQPFFSVKLTAEDVVLLGKRPTLQSIATCLLRKILATQSKGPYTIGGLCLGGILAYEIALQLRAAGHEVSLLVLLDPPNPSCLESRLWLTPKLSHPRYLLKRVARLGLWISVVRIRTQLLKRFARTVTAKAARTQMRVTQGIIQKMVEDAAFAYQPEKYEGNVLLLLASDRPPNENFLLGWQAVVPRSLHAQYVSGHHTELIEEPNVQSVADAIVFHLKSTTERKSSSVVPTHLDQRALMEPRSRLA